jgi:hypothetical protein
MQNAQYIEQMQNNNNNSLHYCLDVIKTAVICKTLNI